MNLGPLLVALSIGQLSQRIERALAELSRGYGVGSGDIRILFVLRRSAPDYALSPTVLFRELLITSGAVSKQVDRLVELGLVRRIPHPDQARGVLIRLEEAGREVADAAMREMATSFCGLETLSDSQVHGVLTSLSGLQELMDSVPELE